MLIPNYLIQYVIFFWVTFFQPFWDEVQSAKGQTLSSEVIPLHFGIGSAESVKKKMTDKQRHESNP